MRCFLFLLSLKQTESYAFLIFEQIIKNEFIRKKIFVKKNKK